MLPLLLAALSLGAGDTAPALNSLELLQTPEVNTGASVAIQFWATGCGPCVEGIPRWNALAEKYKGRVRFVAVTAEDPETVSAFLARRPLAGSVALDLDGTVHEAYGVETVPRVFLVDYRGVIRAVTSLASLRDADLEALAAGRAFEAPEPPGPGAALKIQPDRVPRLLYPYANARASERVVFNWTGVRDAKAFEIQIAERKNFVDPYAEDTTVERHVMIDVLVAGPVWWRVRALDQLGLPGPWSVVRRLEIEPPPLAASVRGIALDATAVAAGGSVDALVTLNDGAPWEGATVLLSASDPALVSMPQRVLFPAGETMARFTVKAAAVEGNAEVNIVATALGEPRRAALRIGPPRPAPALVALAIQPGVLAAGGVAEGSVTLAGQTTDKTTVLLASSDASRVSVPPAVVVPARANGAGFRVRSLHGNTAANVTITASLEGIARTATLNLTAADSQEALPAPVPVAPAYGATLSDNGSGEFTWSSVMSAASYTIEVSAAKGFDGVPAVTRTVPSPSVTIAPLASGTFWWRVRANDAKGSPGRWSTGRPLAVR